ncbi:MAG: RagB/SusD family nutrient uptake outer membrane protein, partial [Bacteroidetes bacterium]|nr:RagB/SusD family nutrient uptake outer membrane protein [Bacteroidota bacterium]
NVTANILEYYTVLRSAEQYLIRAEARNNLDKLSLAIDDINVIRLRAGLALTTIGGQTKADVARLIEGERRKEFFAEMGHRWLDLKRTGKLSETLMPIKSGWQRTDSLYPIPIGEMLTNPNMVQNPGY